VALGDAADNPRYVETISRRGYRFIGTVESAAEPAPACEPTELGHKASGSWPAIGRRHRVAIPAVLILLLAAGGMAEFLHRNKLAHWARNEALPEVVRLFDQGRFTAAYDLAVEAAKYVPDDAILAGLWPDISRTVSIHTTPSGAKVYRKDYAAPDARWEPVGVSRSKTCACRVDSFVGKSTRRVCGG
jgi:hypothetical protein